MMSWLNAEAPENMSDITVTEDTSQPSSGWLNVAARKNMPPISVTEETSQPSSGWLNAEAPLNMLAVFVTEETSQPSSGWLNAGARENMWGMFVTEETSQPSSGWLNAEAPLNMPAIDVTEETSQPSSGWLNAAASSNMLPVLLTEETSQPSRGWLNAAAPQNIPPMSVTEETSQPEMSTLNWSNTTPPFQPWVPLRESPAQNRVIMSVMRLTSQSGISVVPACEQCPSAQQFSPVGTAVRHWWMSSTSSCLLRNRYARAGSAPSATAAGTAIRPARAIDLRASRRRLLDPPTTRGGDGSVEPTEDGSVAVARDAISEETNPSSTSSRAGV